MLALLVPMLDAATLLAQNSDGDTALHLAARRCLLACLRALLAALGPAGVAASVAIRNTQGLSWTDVAAVCGHSGIAQEAQAALGALGALGLALAPARDRDGAGSPQAPPDEAAAAPSRAPLPGAWMRGGAMLLYRPCCARWVGL